jgi:hypothetical protein
VDPPSTGLHSLNQAWQTSDKTFEAHSGFIALSTISANFQTMENPRLALLTLSRAGVLALRTFAMKKNHFGTMQHLTEKQSISHQVIEVGGIV